MPILHILTGPPGSGKTTYAEEKLSGLPVYDTDYNTLPYAEQKKRCCYPKDEWVYSTTECVLMTSAPQASTKEYWLTQAKYHQFTPRLYVCYLPRMVAYNRMTSRSGADRTKQNNLYKSVERWYKLYSRHPLEQRIDTNT